MSQSFGKTWWGEQWLNSLKNIDYSNRIPRGSSYANKGAVQSITIEGNAIKALVSGSRPKPYQVDIILPPFFEPQLSNFITALTQRPVIISKLLNRELDPEVLRLANSMGLKVFPDKWSDMKMQCSCPDWAVPCKHLAAVIYKVSSEIDNNPFLVFNLHRVDLIEELNSRGLFITQENSEIPEILDLYFEKQPQKKVKTIQPNSELPYTRPSFSDLRPLFEPLSALLADAPVFYPGKGNFKDLYKSNLGRVVKVAQRIVQGKLKLQQFSLNFRNTTNRIDTHSHIKIITDTHAQAKVWIDNKAISFAEFIGGLTEIPTSKIPDYQAETAALRTTAFLTLQLLANGAVVPQIIKYPNDQYHVRWLPAMLSKEVRSLIIQMQSILPADLLEWKETKSHKQISKDYTLNLISIFITELMGLLNEHNSPDPFVNLFSFGTPNTFKKPGEASLSGGINTWLQKYYLAQSKYKPQLVVEEIKDNYFQIQINIIDTKKPGEILASLQEILSHKKYDKQRFEILQALALLSSFIEGLDAYINSKGKQTIQMNSVIFTPFLFQMIPAIQLLDIEILLPKSLNEILKPKSSLKIKKKSGNSFLRLDDLLDFDWKVAIGKEVIGVDAFKKLMKQSEGLLKYKSNYIYVSKEELEKLHKHFTSEKPLSKFQLLNAALSGEYNGAQIIITNEVKALINKITQFNEIPLPKGIQATLRPYQLRGYSWMYRNAQVGFGSVIADDMGLGKTLQVIATLLKFKEDKALARKKALIVVPTGLLTNWQAEISKFAPSLKTHVFHGSARKIEPGYDVLLTTYGVARSEAPKLKKLPWHTLIIDEAQNIKNQEAAQTKAIKSIGAENYIAMSGTPVENRLSELWSIMDFSNKGLLGSPKEFNESFGYPIESLNDRKTAEKLKKISAPFMMRRLKSDKTIINDLPDKIEINCYGTLVKEQASLYEKTLDEAMKAIEGIEATDRRSLFVRQGLVLQMILALKQICNHPTQFLKNKNLDASLSGKLAMLFDKLDSIIESNEKVLIFSQFTEMGKLLQYFIQERYSETPLFYHGQSSVKDRKSMVEAFQTNPADKIFLLSLKAAGTGLNLTAANHVIHYDLWWNPAVEAQATDRAYRIGQKNNVMVHRFITKNTFEERINDLIQSKKNLAEMTVSTGENWIGNLSNKELKDLFVLAK